MSYFKFIFDVVLMIACLAGTPAEFRHLPPRPRFSCLAGRQSPPPNFPPNAGKRASKTGARLILFANVCLF